MTVAPTPFLQAALCLPYQDQLAIFKVLAFASQKPTSALPDSSFDVPQLRLGNITVAAGRSWCVGTAPLLPGAAGQSEPVLVWNNSFSSNGSTMAGAGANSSNRNSSMSSNRSSSGSSSSSNSSASRNSTIPRLLQGMRQSVAPPLPTTHLSDSISYDATSFSAERSAGRLRYDSNPSTAGDGERRAVLGLSATLPSAVALYQHVEEMCSKPAILLDKVELAVPTSVAMGGPGGAAGGFTASLGEGLGTFTVSFINSAWVECPRPITNCSGNMSALSPGASLNGSPGLQSRVAALGPTQSVPCLAAAYALINPDNNAAAVVASGVEAAAQASQDLSAAAGGESGGDGGSSDGGGPNSSHGISVILPAVLGSVGKLGLIREGASRSIIAGPNAIHTVMRKCFRCTPKPPRTCFISQSSYITA
jgi:hypothetical protein